MKLIKVKITRNTNPGEPRMKYPDVYDANEIEMHKSGNIIYEGRLARGENIEHCLICVSDELAEKYSNASDDIEIVTKAQADRWLKQNPDLQEQPSERVTDSDRLLAILAKKAAGVPLSQEDIDVVDPSKKVKGIEKVPKTVDELFPTLS